MPTAESHPSLAGLKTRRASVRPILLVWACVFLGCAAQSPVPSAAPQNAEPASPAPTAFAEAPSGAPYSPSSSEPVPKTVDEAVAQLEQAEAKLNSASNALTAKSAAGGAEAAQGTSPPPPPQRMASGDEEARGSPCFSACRALDSMGRATQYLCELAGDRDARCEGARARLESAHKRVTDACTCPPAG